MCDSVLVVKLRALRTCSVFVLVRTLFFTLGEDEVSVCVWALLGGSVERDLFSLCECQTVFSGALTPTAGNKLLSHYDLVESECAAWRDTCLFLILRFHRKESRPIA